MSAATGVSSSTTEMSSGSAYRRMKTKLHVPPTSPKRKTAAWSGLGLGL